MPRKIPVSAIETVIAGIESRLDDEHYPRQAIAEYALYALQKLTGQYRQGDEVIENVAGQDDVYDVQAGVVHGRVINVRSGNAQVGFQADAIYGDLDL